MGRSAKVGHAKPLKTVKSSDAAPGHQHKNSALIPFRFFLKKSHPRKRNRTPHTSDGEPTLSLRRSCPLAGKADMTNLSHHVCS